MSDSGARWLLVVGAIAVLAVGVWWYTGDERRIEKRLAALEHAVSKSGPEAELEAFAKAGEVADLLADPFIVRAEAFDFSSGDRRAVIGRVNLYRSQSETIAVDSFDHQLSVQGGRATSVVSFAITGDFGTRQMVREVYRFRIEWTRADGWKMAEVELLETEGTRDRWGF